MKIDSDISNEEYMGCTGCTEHYIGYRQEFFFDADSDEEESFHSEECLERFYERRQSAGPRVQFIADYDLAFPDTYIEKGETGALRGPDEDGNYIVVMDREFDTLDEWDNGLLFNHSHAEADKLSLKDFMAQYIKVI